jgi:hypothetical protein
VDAIYEMKNTVREKFARQLYMAVLGLLLLSI